MDEGWVSGYWHFSFDSYVDPKNERFGTLRVFNVDTLAPGAAWPMHPHRNIEVVTYCADGEFQHADSLGTDGGPLLKGHAMHTTVGKGMSHSEINHSKTAPVTFIQLWILPGKPNLEPAVRQLRPKPEERHNRFLPLVSNRQQGAMPIQQDAEVYVAALDAGIKRDLPVDSGMGVYFYVISGKIRLEGEPMEAGDAAKVWEDSLLQVEAVEPSEVYAVVVAV